MIFDSSHVMCFGKSVVLNDCPLFLSRGSRCICLSVTVQIGGCGLLFTDGFGGYWVDELVK